MIDLEEAEELASALIARWESFRSKPYLCAAGVPTIGVGATRYADGTPVTLNDPPMSRVDGETLLHHMVQTIYMPAALKLCPGADTSGRLAALTSFAYNLGVNALKNSTLRRRVNEGDWERVPDEFRKWVRASGRVLRGLVLRREAEIGYL